MLKNGRKMSPMEAKAKLATLKSLMKEMDDMMFDSMKNAKGMKVSIMSDSPEGLKEGIEKAEELLEKKSELGFDSHKLSKMTEKEDEEEKEGEEEISNDEEEESAEDLDAKIAELLTKKKRKESQLKVK
jgi:uncharacterized protein YabN with tetrapyrrole methylase and pyrophosphatase domain